MQTSKFLTTGAAALALGLAVAAVSTPAEAQWRRGYRGGWGPGIAAGVVGGALLGSALAARPYYGGAYYDPYYAAPVYGGCWRERRPVYDRWGNFRGYRLIRVCN